MPAGKSLLVFALEPHAAARFEALVAAFGSLHVCRDDAAGASRSNAQASRPEIIVVTRHWPAWLDRLQRNADRFDAIYLRPAALLMLDIFDRMFPGSGDELSHRRRGLRSLDGRLSGYHVLSVEDLFDQTARASQTIARLLTDLTGAAVCATRAVDTDHGSSYDASVAGLLLPAPTDSTFAHHAVPDSLPDSAPVVELDAVHSTADGALGTAVLEAGWSHPEPSYVWSDGRRAALRFSVPATGGPFRCQLRGFVVGGDFAVRAYVADNRVGMVDKPRQQPRDIDIDIPLTLTRDHRAGPVRVSLEFDGAVSPFDAGLSEDRRTLGLALKSFRIYSVRPALAQQSRLESTVETLHRAGYRPLGSRAHDGNFTDAPAAVSRTDPTTPRFYPSWRPGICMLVVPSVCANIADPIRYCAALHCELILLVGDTAVGAELVPGAIDGPQVIRLTDTLEQGLDALTPLQLQPDTIVVWAATPDAAAIATIAARLRAPTAMTSDLVLQTEDLRSLEPLIVDLQQYADVVIALDGAVLISSRARSERGRCP